MSNNFDINEIATDLNGKADLDLTNTIGALSASSKNYFSGLGMPSDRYIDLELGATGTQYTAPANGYAFLRIRFTSSGNQLEVNRYMGDTLIQGSTLRSYGSGYIAVALPVQKNQIFQIDYVGTIDTSAPRNIFRFIYAEGESEE